MTNTETAERKSIIRVPIAVGAMVLLVILAFTPSLQNGFVSDDNSLVGKRAAALESSGGLKQLVTNPYWWGTGKTGAKYHLYRPFTSATWWLDFQIGGASPWIYHLSNMLVHAAVVVLVFLVLSPFAGKGIAFSVAALCGVGPIAVTSVGWAAGRTDLWAALFVLAYLVFFERARLCSSPVWIVAAAICFFLGLVSKETAIIAPVLAWGLERNASLLPAQSKPAGKTARYIYLLLPLGVYLWLRHEVLGAVGIPAAAEKAFPIWHLVATLPEQMLRTAVHAVFPLHYNFYSEFLWSGEGQRGLWFVLGWCFFLALVALIIAGLIRKRLWAVGGLWYGLTLIPAYASGQAWAPLADFYAYAGLPGLWLFILDGGREIISNRGGSRWLKNQRLLYPIFGLVFFGFAIVTFLRLPILRSNLTLARHSAEREPASQTALIAVAKEYFAAGQITQAENWLDRASALRSDNLTPWVVRAKYYLANAMPEKAAPAVDTLAVRGRDSAEAQAVIARYYYEMGRCDLAVDTYRRSVSLGYPSVETLFDYGVALLCNGNDQTAADIFELAASFTATWPEAHFYRGEALLNQNRLREAAEAYRTAAAQSSQFTEAWEKLATTYWRIGDKRAAIQAANVYFSMNPPVENVDRLRKLLE